jgi:hypothetical protein
MGWSGKHASGKCLGLPALSGKTTAFASAQFGHSLACLPPGNPQISFVAKPINASSDWPITGRALCKLERTAKHIAATKAAIDPNLFLLQASISTSQKPLVRLDNLALYRKNPKGRRWITRSLFCSSSTC